MRFASGIVLEAWKTEGTLAQSSGTMPCGWTVCPIRYEELSWSNGHESSDSFNIDFCRDSAADRTAGASSAMVFHRHGKRVEHLQL